MEESAGARTNPNENRLGVDRLATTSGNDGQVADGGEMLDMPTLQRRTAPGEYETISEGAEHKVAHGKEAPEV